MHKANSAARVAPLRPNHPVHGIDADQFPMGLPKTFDRIGTWTQRLYRRSPKEIVKQWIEHDPDIARTFKAIRQSGGDDYEDILISLWAEPGIRMDVLRGKNSKVPQAPELRILDLYLERHPSALDKLDALRERFPDWWVFVDMQANHLRREFSKRLVALSPAFDALTRWDSLDAEERDWTEAVIFAASGLLSTRLVIDAAIRVQPALEERFKYMEWNAELPLGNYLLPRVDLLSERAVYDCPALRRFLDGATYFSVDYHRDRLTPYDVCDVLERVESLHRLADLELLREDIGKVLAASRVKFLASYKSYGVETLERLDIPMPFDFIALANRMIEFATPVRDIRYSLSMLRRLQAFAMGILQVMNGARPIISDIDEKIATMQRLVSHGAAGHIEEVGVLSSEIVKLKQTVGEMLQVLLAHKEVPSLPMATAPVAANDQAAVPVAVDGEETLLHENQTLAGEVRRLAGVERDLLGQIHVLETRMAQPQQFPRDKLSIGRAVADLAVEVGQVRPADMLRVIAKLYDEERVVVLPSAYKSAERSSSFQFVPRLYKLLTLLVTAYRDALVAGKPDSKARHILGGSYRANESEATSMTQKLAKLRTFEYEGRKVQMFQHIAIGVEDSDSRTIRCHFYWDAAKKRIVIGYLGPHLPTRDGP